MEEGTGDQGPPSAQLDLARLAEISDGDADFEREIVAEYLEQSQGLVEEAARALAGDDVATLHRVAHTLKGSSRTVGAEGVAAAAAALERAAEHSTDGAAPILGRARACLLATEREFDRHFGTDRGRRAA